MVICSKYIPFFLPRRVLPYESEVGARRKILRTLLKGTRILFYERIPGSQIHFRVLRGTNSTTTNYITGTAHFNSIKDNFRTLSSQGLFESILINRYPNETYCFLAAVILVLAPLAVPIPTNFNTPTKV